MSISDLIIKIYGKEQLKQLKNMSLPEAKKVVRLLLKRDCPKYVNKWSSLTHITQNILNKLQD